MTDLRYTFNEDAENYEQYRPVYKPEIFDKIISKSSNALEVGVGTGQATSYIIETGCSLMGVELGTQLAAFTREKFKPYENLEIINGDFEQLDYVSNSFDLIYSATAFHWIDEAIGYNKVKTLLKPGGVIALLWNKPSPGKGKVYDKIQDVYIKYRPDTKAPLLNNKGKYNERIGLLKKYGFKDIEFELYHDKRTFDSKSYIGLLNTYSDHRAMPNESRLCFEQEIAEIIKNHGDEFIIYDTIDLYIAYKK
jgi:SAM-dependent methyltransferase